MRISDWSSDVCSSDLVCGAQLLRAECLFALHDHAESVRTAGGRLRDGLRARVLGSGLAGLPPHWNVLGGNGAGDRKSVVSGKSVSVSVDLGGRRNIKKIYLSSQYTYIK